MIEEGIFDGDWVVIEQRVTARNGEIVVALVDDEDATLKRFEKMVLKSSCILRIAACHPCTTPQRWFKFKVYLSDRCVAITKPLQS